MNLESLLRMAIEHGRLREPFSAEDATRAVARADWPRKRVHSYLVRHCRGNLAAVAIYFDRASFGQYRLLGAEATARRRAASSGRRGWTRRESPNPSPPTDRREV